MNWDEFSKKLKLGTIEKNLGEVRSVTSDSRQVGPGVVFVAVVGSTRDGHEFAEAALQAGAIAVIGEKPSSLSGYIRVADSRRFLASAAATLAGHPSRSMKMIGVTGTSGKTSLTYLIESILKEAGLKVGVIGTIEVRIGSQVLPSSHTTPGAVELQVLLARMKSEGCDAVVMEASSHALQQHRVGEIAFDAVAFTNLSPEHLDYHPTMESYYEAKRLLFTDFIEASAEAGKQTVAVVNQDDSYGRRLIDELKRDRRRLLTYSLQGGDVSGLSWQASHLGISGTYRGVSIESEWVGTFNASNILAAIATAEGLGIDSKTIARGIQNQKMVPGRMQRVSNSHGLGIWVDYAHKPDALEKVLKNLQPSRETGRLFVLFGCGGDRDRTKRPAMAAIAERLSDLVVVTSDNPRNEDPDAIIREIRGGFKDESLVLIEPDREKAIVLAISRMKKGDLLVIAGKGHEKYQQIGAKQIPFDDVEVASRALTRIFENP